MPENIKIFDRLECNYLAEPCGIAVESPVFSWQGGSAVLKIYSDSGELLYTSNIPVDSPFRPDWLPEAQKRYLWSINNEDQSVQSSFETAYSDDFDWAPACWLCNHFNPGVVQAPSNLFTREFLLPELPEGFRARLYIGALGVYEAKLNDQIISDRVLAPGAVDFASRTIYQTYEVEKFLKNTKNHLAIELSGGWHSGAIARAGDNFESCFYGEPDALIVRLEVWRDAESAPELLLFSDASWQVTHLNTRRSDIYMGEIFDASQPVGEPDPFVSEIALKTKLDPRNASPVRRIMELEPCQIVDKGDHFIVDFGQNFAGREKITFNAPRGTLVTIRHGEMLNADGTLYTENLRSAKAETRITAPGGEYTFEPVMTFYGFRYLEIKGVKDFSVKAVVLHSDLELTSRFDCSNKLLNKFMQNVLWSQRSNFLDIPTDCPQRDERRGWTGDAQVFIPTALYNMHAAAFFRKYMCDLRSCTAPDGRFPNFVPSYPYGNLRTAYGISGWADAGVIIPYQLYLNYGDREFLQENLRSICRWIDYQAEHAQDGFCQSTRFKDWLNQNDPTGEGFISTAYFTYGASLAEKIADTLGDQTTASRMKKHHTAGYNAFRRHFLDGNGELVEKSQCAAAMALEFDLLEDPEKASAVQMLADNIARHEYHLTTGFLGTPLLLSALSNHGKLDLAYQLLEQTTCPSWLYPVTQNATTIWERWDSWSEKDGFGDVGMNSFNHYAYGAAAAWIYQCAAGIKPLWEAPGFRKFILAPQPGGSLEHLSVEFASPAGLIKSAWQRKENQITYRFTVPAGSSAELRLPEAAGTEVLTPGDHTFTFPCQ